MCRDFLLWTTRSIFPSLHKLLLALREELGFSMTEIMTCLGRQTKDIFPFTIMQIRGKLLLSDY
jgi:hypothetical protein